MIIVNIHEAKAKLSEYVEAAAERRANGDLQAQSARRRVAHSRTDSDRAAGSHADVPGTTFVTPAFFEPLSADEIAAWEGSDREMPSVAESRGADAPRTAVARKRKART